jgi:phospholipase/carboxylesterase
MKGAWEELAGLTYLRVEPTDRDASELPLIVAIHGRGADARDLAGLAGELHPGRYRWVLPQGPRPVNLGMGSIGWAWYELGDQQETTVRSSREQLDRFLGELLPTLGITRDRTLLMGFSQGAVMTLHAGLVSPEPYAGLAAMSGYLPAADDLLPLLPQRTDRRIVMVHGTQDQVLGIHLAHQARDLLTSAGLHVEYHEFPMDHQITSDSLAVVRRFVDDVLPAEAVP